MSTSTTQSQSQLNTLKEVLKDVLDSYGELDMSRKRYMSVVLFPATVFFFVTLVATVIAPLPLIVRVPIPLLGLLVIAAAALYPKVYLSQRRIAIENKFHLVVTHMTVLSTTNVSRLEVFRTVAREEEYGVLAEEMARVVYLVDTWNQSLDEACRRRSKEVPSRVLADFFERLAYTLSSGQAIDEFLLNEQDIMMENYATVYNGALDNLSVMKDLYMSMILSMTFALVFAIVLPVLTGVNPTYTVAAVISMFIFVQVGFFFVIRTMAPFDPVWFLPEPTGVHNWKFWAPLAGCVFVSVVLTGLAIASVLGVNFGIIDAIGFIDSLPLPVYVALPVTPLIIPGLVFRQEEELIKERDDEFPNFIRALGAAETAKQSTTSAVLETLREKDFGALTPEIDTLYKRLNIRVGPDYAWEDFTLDSKSYLIQKFSEMFLVGRAKGGTPKVLGDLISRNMNTINQLREKRRQETVTLTGLLYGITAASTFAFFIGLEVVDILADFSESLDIEQFDFGQLIQTAAYNIDVITGLLTSIIVFNAALSALMIRTIDGGHKASGLIHFVLMTWLGCLTAVFTSYMVGALIQI